MELSLAFIGWFFKLTSAGAIVLGAALIVLLLLSAASRLYALRQPDPRQPPVNWLGGIGGITLILIPVIAICAATIVTLRSPEAMKAFS